MSEGSHRPAPTSDNTLVNERVWHPWLRVNRVIRAVLTTSWDAEQWPVAKRALRRTLMGRSKIARAGWFS